MRQPLLYQLRGQTKTAGWNPIPAIGRFFGRGAAPAERAIARAAPRVTGTPPHAFGGRGAPATTGAPVRAPVDPRWTTSGTPPHAAGMAARAPAALPAAAAAGRAPWWRHVANTPTALGGVAGAFGYANDASPVPSTGNPLVDLPANILAGAASFNPRLNRMVTRGRRGASLAASPLGALRGGYLGGAGGSAIDFLGSQVGLGDLGAEQFGMQLGRAGGGIQGLGRGMRPLLNRGSRAHNLATSVGNLGRGISGVAEAPGQALNNILHGRGPFGRAAPGAIPTGAPGTLAHTRATARAAAGSPPRPGYNLAQGFGVGAGTVASLAGIGKPLIKNLGQAVGHEAAGPVLNAGADAMFGREGHPEDAGGWLGSGMNAVEGRMDEYMRSRGLMGEDGRFSLAGGMPGGAGGGMGRMAGSALQGLMNLGDSPIIDRIFAAVGVDSSRMSGPQKMMILGSLGVGGVGAATGHPLMAGLGLLGAGAGAMGGRRPGPVAHDPRLTPRNELAQQAEMDELRSRSGRVPVGATT